MSKLNAVAIGAGTVAVKTFASYDDAIRQVYATMGMSEAESAAEMNALSDAAQEMDASIRCSAREAASALNYLALAGCDSEKAIAAMETAAKDAGQTAPTEVLAAKEALEQVKSAATDTSNVFSEDVASSIGTMFSGPGDETHEVFASLNCDNLSTAYDAWAAGEHVSIIPSLDTVGLTEIDITGNITSAATPEGTAFAVDAEGHITSVSKPDGVTYAVDTQGNVTGITSPDGMSFSVDTQGNVTSIPTGGDHPFTVDCSGNITDVVSSEGSTYETDVTGSILAVTTPNGATFMADTAGNITSVTTESGVTYSVDGSGRITAVALDPNTVLPTVDLQATATVSKVSFYEGHFTSSGRSDLEFAAGAGRTDQNLLGLTDFSAPETVARLYALADGIRDLNAAQAEVSSMEAQGIPDMSAYETARQRVDALSESVSTLGQSFGGKLVAQGSMGFQAMAQYVANGMQLMNDGALDGSQIEQYAQVVSDLTTVMNSQTGEAAASARARPPMISARMPRLPLTTMKARCATPPTAIPPPRGSIPSATRSRRASGEAWASTISPGKRKVLSPPSRARSHRTCSSRPAPRLYQGLLRA